MTADPIDAESYVDAAAAAVGIAPASSSISDGSPPWRGW
jgi:hypothetical protein